MDHSHHQHSEHQPAHNANGKAHQAHDKHAGHHTHDFLRRFWVCLILTIPVLLLRHMIQSSGWVLTFLSGEIAMCCWRWGV